MNWIVERTAPDPQVADPDLRHPVGQGGIDVEPRAICVGRRVQAAQDRDEAEHRARRPGLGDVGADIRDREASRDPGQPGEELRQAKAANRSAESKMPLATCAASVANP